MKKRVRQVTKRNRGRTFPSIIKELSTYLRGWQNYFKLGLRSSSMGHLDSWKRRRLRCYRLKQRKRKYSIAMWLISLGVAKHNAWKVAVSNTVVLDFFLTYCLNWILSLHAPILIALFLVHRVVSGDLKQNGSKVHIQFNLTQRTVFISHHTALSWFWDGIHAI
ncbi:group II intron maturase-specific domain-containing protein [Shewanella electrica]|uniref:group II intron maturase-specific domain-containing protein n=1 Tax=Shewanella electrica TaxID=515560 RepID=UPI0034DD128F